MITAAAIEAALRAALAPLGPHDAIEVINESHLHAGHPGAGQDTHWRVRVVAGCMAGLSRPARHRLVYDALSSLISQGIHALAIEARGPAET